MARTHSKRPQTANRLRIIGGRWRGRRLTFAPVPDLRPTTDRVRETLFNWLQPTIGDARCLDLFSGSGALGLEALSREAREVVMVDSDRRVIEQLRANLVELQAAGAEVRQADVLRYLEAGAAAPFDIVFLDPPFRRGLVERCCELLERGGWLTPQALIYVEAEETLDPLPLPAGWQIHRSKRAGQVGYHLIRADGA